MAKVSGGFRSHNGGTRFGNIMSVIKTSKLRGINPFNSINEIINEKFCLNTPKKTFNMSNFGVSMAD